MSDTGTIDITALVEMMKSTWIKWAVGTAFAAIVAIPGFGWLAYPIIDDLFRAALNFASTAVANGGEMMAFFENTAIRKAGQAGDYVKAKTELNNLPPTVSQDEYEKYEQIEMLSFSNFVRVTN